MGVPLAWDLLKNGFSRRVQFAEFVEKWNAKHHRPLRIAIDAYMWLFEACGGIPLDDKSLKTDEVIGKILINFMSRLRLLISLNVSFVFVFDGRFKPSFKRKLTSNKDEVHLHDKDFDSYYKDAMTKIKYERYNQADTKEVIAMKKLLTLWNMAYVEAPGEGEAEAARLQREGLVDYVVSNDSDTLAFGASKVLRNFSKYVADLPASAIQKKPSSSEQDEDDMPEKTRHTYWVTPVEMDKVEDETGYDTSRILMFSILLGAYYNKGVGRLGATRAGQLALSGDAHIIEHVASFDYTMLPDFSQELYKIYAPEQPLSGVERRRRYVQLQEDITRHVSEKPKAYFGRKETISCAGFAPDFVVNLYFRPLLCPKAFKWASGHNNAESEVFPLMNYTPLYEFLLPYPWPGVKEKLKYFAVTMTECYMYKWILEHQGSMWQDRDNVEFVKVLQQDEDGHKRLSLNIKHGLFKEFQMTNFYINPAERAKGFTTKISIELLPSALSEHVCSMENDRRSPSKSPKKSKLPTASKQAKQRALSPSDLSPSKALFSKSVAAPKKKPLKQQLEDEIQAASKRSTSFRIPMSSDQASSTSPQMKRTRTLMPEFEIPRLHKDSVPSLKKARTEIDDPFGSTPIHLPTTSTVTEASTQKTTSMVKATSMSSTSSSTSLPPTQKIESRIKLTTSATNTISPKKSRHMLSPSNNHDIVELLSPKKSKSTSFGSTFPLPGPSLTLSTLKLPSMDALSPDKTTNSSSRSLLSSSSSTEEKPARNRIMMPSAARGLTPPMLKRGLAEASSKESSATSSTSSSSTCPDKKVSNPVKPILQPQQSDIIDLDTPEPAELPKDKDNSRSRSETSEILPTPKAKDLSQLQTLESPSRSISKSSQSRQSAAMMKLTLSAMKDLDTTLKISESDDDIQVLSGEEMESAKKRSDFKQNSVSPMKKTPVKKKQWIMDDSPVKKFVVNNKEHECISLDSDDDGDITVKEVKGKNVEYRFTLSPANEVAEDVDFSEDMSDDMMSDTNEVVAAPTGSQIMGSQMSSQAMLEDIDLSDSFDDDL